MRTEIVGPLLEICISVPTKVPSLWPALLFKWVTCWDVIGYNDLWVFEVHPGASQSLAVESPRSLAQPLLTQRKGWRDGSAVVLVKVSPALVKCHEQ